MPRIRLSDEMIQRFTADMKDAELRIQESHREKWNKVSAAYYGQSRASVYGGIGSDEDVNFNFMLSTANTILPSVLATDPHIALRPRTPADIGAAEVGESALNYVYRVGHAHQRVSAIVLDAVMFGVGVGKAVYNDAENTTPVYDYDREAYFDLDPDDDADDGLGEAIEEAMEEDGIYADNSDKTPDVPKLERVAPWNFLYPTGAEDIGKCPWVAERLLVRLTELRMMPGFKVSLDIVATEVALNPASSSLQEAHSLVAGATTDFVIVYEIHYWVRKGTKMRRRILWLLDEGAAVSGADRVLAHMDDDSGMRGYPFVMLRTSVTPGRMYDSNISDLASVHQITERLNDELAAVLRHHRAASKQKYVCLPGSLGEDSSLPDLLASDADMEACELPANVGDVRAAIQLVPIAPMSNDVPWVINQLQRLIYEIGGVDVYQRGGVGRKGTSATEVAAVSKGSQDRAAVRKRAIEVFIGEVASRWLDVMRHFWTDSRWIRVAGEDGADEFVQVDSARLRGMFDIEVSVNEYDPKDQANEVAAFNGLLQTINATVASLQPLVQAGVMPPDTIQKFIDRSFAIWKQDKRRLIGTLSSMMNPVAGAGGAPPASEGGGGEADLLAMMGGGGSINGNGYDPQTTGSLAGTGPRPGAGESIQ